MAANLAEYTTELYYMFPKISECGVMICHHTLISMAQGLLVTDDRKRF